MATYNKQTTTRNQSAWIWTYDSQGYGNSGVVVGAPCILQSFIVSCKAASGVLWLQFFDGQAVPGNGAVPLFAPVALAANSSQRVVLNDVGGHGYDGLQTASGLVWAASTTPATLTIDSTSSVWTTVRYF